MDWVTARSLNCGLGLLYSLKSSLYSQVQFTLLTSKVCDTIRGYSTVWKAEHIYYMHSSRL